MSKFGNLDALGKILDGSFSRHKTARALRFVYRHPRAHRGLIRVLNDRQRRAEKLAAAQRHTQALEWERAPLAKGAPRRKMRHG